MHILSAIYASEGHKKACLKSMTIILIVSIAVIMMTTACKYLSNEELARQRTSRSVIMALGHEGCEERYNEIPADN